jgi:methylmalonyl-CoA/ethylmalonyl-CoA epimerase
MSTATSPAITGVGQVFVNVKDLPRAIAFYRDALGLRYLFEIPGSAFFQLGNLRLMIGVAEKPEFDHPASILYYSVADIQASFATLKAAGAGVETEPHLIARMPDHELWMAFLRDSEGNYFALMSEVR